MPGKDVRVPILRPIASVEINSPMMGTLCPSYEAAVTPPVSVKFVSAMDEGDHRNPWL